MPIKTLKPDKKILRISIILCAVSGLIFFAFSFKWYIAHTISIYSQDKNLSDLSVTLAPDDPQTHYSSAILLEKTFTPEDLERSLSEYQKTAALSPNNYLSWLDLGRAYEHAGKIDLAERSFLRAEQLAPNYANVKWIFGNFLFRNGKPDEGFQKIRFAAENNGNFTGSFITTVWQNFDGDVEKTKQIIGESIKLKSAFSVFLANQKKFEESIMLWNSLPDAEKTSTLKTDGEAIYNQLIAEKRFLQALEIKSQASESLNVEIGKIANGGFENEIQTKTDSIFDWSIADGLHPVIGFDNNEVKDGTRSLVYIFNSDDGRDYRIVSQTIAVRSNAKYTLKFFYKSALKTNSTIKCDVINPFDGSLIAATEPIKAVSDWMEVSLDFTVPENTQGIVIKMIRDACKSPICPISGKVWLDDFSLTEK